MNFGESIKNLLFETGKTQQDLAGSIGYTQRAVSKWINNQAEPSERAIVACADFFSVSADYLLGLTDDYRSVQSMPVGVQSLSPEELSLIKKYRSLSAPNKKYLNQTIEILSGAHEQQVKRKRG